MAAGDEVVDSAEHAEGSEGRDDRRHPQVRDEDPVDDPEQQAETDPDEDRDRRSERVRFEGHGHDIGDDSDRGLHRQVDVPGEDHERLAEGRDRGHRGEDRDLA